GRAARADDELRIARRARLPPLGRRSARARAGWHGLALRRDRRHRRVQADARSLLGVDAAILAVLDWPCSRRADANRTRSRGKASASGCHAAMSDVVLATHSLHK